MDGRQDLWIQFFLKLEEEGIQARFPLHFPIGQLNLEVLKIQMEFDQSWSVFPNSRLMMTKSIFCFGPSSKTEMKVKSWKVVFVFIFIQELTGVTVTNEYYQRIQFLSLFLSVQEFFNFWVAISIVRMFSLLYDHYGFLDLHISAHTFRFYFSVANKFYIKPSTHFAFLGFFSILGRNLDTILSRRRFQKTNLNLIK